MNIQKESFISIMGKATYAALLYLAFWCIFYGNIFLIPREYYIENDTGNGVVGLIYIFLIVPLISFFIPRHLHKKFGMNRVLLYAFHVLYLFISIAVFLYFGLRIALSNQQFG